jgi:hypothetical protein
MRAAEAPFDISSVINRNSHARTLRTRNEAVLGNGTSALFGRAASTTVVLAKLRSLQGGDAEEMRKIENMELLLTPGGEERHGVLSGQAEFGNLLAKRYFTEGRELWLGWRSLPTRLRAMP